MEVLISIPPWSFCALRFCVFLHFLYLYDFFPFLYDTILAGSESLLSSLFVKNVMNVIWSLDAREPPLDFVDAGY
jgi:hypothetical protein